MALAGGLVAQAAELPKLTLLVGNKAENSMVFVDPATNMVLGKVPTGNGPHEIAASSDGKVAFVANYGTGPAPARSLVRGWKAVLHSGSQPRGGPLRSRRQ